MRLKKFVFKNVNSTNDSAIKIIMNSNNKSGIVIADKQKKGRGRYGKKWTSYKGNLFVTIFFNFDKINVSLKKMTHLNCSLIKKLLSFYYKKKISIKAPNDLLINKKKISGILQEMIKKDNNNYMIVGVGINLIKSPNINNYPTTNLTELTKKNVNKKKIVLEIKTIYENFISKFSRFNLKTIKNL